MKRISLLLVLGLAIISLAGCGEVETQEKILPDGSKVTVDAAGKILSEEKVSTDSDFVTPKNTNLDSENVTLFV